MLETIDCEGSAITIDAVASQRDITKEIIEKKADYLIGLKSNHGRGEIRSTYTCEDLQFLEETYEWSGLKSIVMTESRRIIDGKETTSERFYISSLSGSKPERYARLVRDHWGIENGLRWHLDVTFREDQFSVYKKNRPAKRKFALFCFQKKNPK